MVVELNFQDEQVMDLNATTVYVKIQWEAIICYVIWASDDKVVCIYDSTLISCL